MTNDVCNTQLQFQLAIPARLPAANNRISRWLAGISSLAALGQFSGRTDGMTAPGATAFAASHRVSDRVHRRAANVRATPLVPHASRFSDHDLDVIRIADDAD